MDYNYGYDSWADSMTTGEIDNLTFPPLDGGDWHDPFQSHSAHDMEVSISIREPSMFLNPDLSTSDSQATDKIFATLIADDEMNLEQSLRASEAASRMLDGADSTQMSQPALTSDLTSEQQMPGIEQENSSPPKAGSGHKKSAKRIQQSRQSTPSRISSTGAIKKVAKSEPIALPPQAAQALMTTPGLQKFAHIEDANKLPPRIRNRILFRPEEVYSKLDSKPINCNVFSYNEYGELKAGQTFTVDEVFKYLYQHPLHTLSNGQFNAKEGGLKL